MSDSYKILKFKASEFPGQYRAMIFSKFLRSLRYGNTYFRLIDPKSYYKVYHQYLSTLLERPSAILNLAVLSDDVDVVLGWSLIEESTLHYVYVNKDNRQIGVATSLVTTSVDTFTHVTNMAFNIWQKKLPKAKFDPFETRKSS